MDPHRNDKFKHTEPEFHNTKDAFGNQLNVGDEVYYFKRDGKTVRFSAEYGGSDKGKGGKRRSKTYPGIAQAMAEQWGILN